MIIALPGDMSKNSMLKNDMGVDWVDHYWQANGWESPHKEYQKLIDFISPLDSVILVGFSRGGSMIAKLSNELTNIKAAVLYESPMVDSTTVGGNFPVLMIWNNEGRLVDGLPRSRFKATYSIYAWAKDHPMTFLMGDGGHVKTNPLGHDWDKSLNTKIKNWIDNAT